MLIWWLFDDYLINDYLVIIRWLFEFDYSWLFDDYLIQIIRDYLMIIWFLGQQQVGWFASFPKAFAWNSLVMAAFRLRKSQPASLACYLLQKLRINWNHPLVFHDDFDPPSALPRSTRRVFLREVLDPAITQYLTDRDGIQHPAHESRLPWSRVFSPMCYQGLRLEPIIIKIIIIIAIITISIIWLITCWACSALLKPKCQKMSSTRCSIFSLKR